jgi:cytidylate kinase
MPVITIGRQFGAGGSDVARIVAKLIEAEVVDRELIAEVARRMGAETGEIEAEDEHPTRLVDRLARAMSPMAFEFGVAWEPPYTDPAYDPRRAILDLEREVIREVAARGSAVIVGRGGAFVLADHPTALHVYLVAPIEVRLRTIMDRMSLSEDAARRRLHEIDANRAAYASQLYGADWGDPIHYDLVLNTARLGYQATADVIRAALEARTVAAS